MLTHDVPALAQTLRAAMGISGKAETPPARITSELFVITQLKICMPPGVRTSCAWL